MSGGSSGGATCQTLTADGPQLHAEAPAVNHTPTSQVRSQQVCLFSEVLQRCKRSFANVETGHADYYHIDGSLREQKFGPRWAYTVSEGS